MTKVIDLRAFATKRSRAEKPHVFILMVHIVLDSLVLCYKTKSPNLPHP